MPDDPSKTTSPYPKGQRSITGSFPVTFSQVYGEIPGLMVFTPTDVIDAALTLDPVHLQLDIRTYGAGKYAAYLFGAFSAFFIQPILGNLTAQDITLTIPWDQVQRIYFEMDTICIQARPQNNSSTLLFGLTSQDNQNLLQAISKYFAVEGYQAEGQTQVYEPPDELLVKRIFSSLAYLSRDVRERGLIVPYPGVISHLAQTSGGSMEKTARVLHKMFLDDIYTRSALLGNLSAWGFSDRIAESALHELSTINSAEAQSFSRELLDVFHTKAKSFVPKLTLIVISSGITAIGLLTLWILAKDFNWSLFGLTLGTLFSLGALLPLTVYLVRKRGWKVIEERLNNQLGSTQGK